MGRETDRPTNDPPTERQRERAYTHTPVKGDKYRERRGREKEKWARRERTREGEGNIDREIKAET